MVVLHVCVCVRAHMCVCKLPQTGCGNVTSVVQILCFIKQAGWSFKQTKTLLGIYTSM